MATKFERIDCWQALEAEDRMYWKQRTADARAAAVLELSSELLAIGRQVDSGRMAAAGRARRAEKLRGWIALKERLQCPSVNPENSKTFSAGL